jgi:hypothetical protein
MPKNTRKASDHESAQRAQRQAGGRLMHLDDLRDRFTIAAGNPDVRGWPVRTSDGLQIGEVDSLLLDSGLGEVRYIEVKLLADFVREGDAHWTLVPVGWAEVDGAEDVVRLGKNAGELRGRVATDWQRTGQRTLVEQVRAMHERSARGIENVHDEAWGDQLCVGDDFDETRFLRKRGRPTDSTSAKRYLAPVTSTSESSTTRSSMRGVALPDPTERSAEVISQPPP